MVKNFQFPFTGVTLDSYYTIFTDANRRLTLLSQNGGASTGEINFHYAIHIYLRSELKKLLKD